MLCCGMALLWHGSAVAGSAGAGGSAGGSVCVSLLQEPRPH